jgi:RHS repeat-associated protein
VNTRPLRSASRASTNPGGLIKTDSLRIQTVERNDWERHKYGIRYTYDLDGRRDSLFIPHQLRAGNDSAISYAYDPQLGFLQTLKDLQRNPYTFGYNPQGQLSFITYPGKYSRAISYDVDGRVIADTIRNDSTALYPRIPKALVRAARLFYDARNKLLQSGDSAGRFRDTLKASYTGLGNLSASLWIQHGCVNCDLSQGTRHATLEYVNQQDGLANRRLRTVVDAAVWGTFPNGGWSGNPDVTDTSTYERYTGRLTSVGVSYPAEMPRRYYSYDQAGSNDFSWALSQAKPSSERASFFAADGSLRMVDSRAAVHDHAQSTEPQEYAVEEYRYDALGRRVWVRAQRRCIAPTSQFEATECRTSLIRRTIWDGSNELAEIQMPWAIQGTFVEHSITEYPDLVENDTLPVSVSQMLAPGPAGMGDPNPYFGHVVYAGLLGADQPVAVTRVNYVFKQDWHYPSTTYSPTLKAPFTIVPFWDPRGDARGGVVSSGVMKPCDPPAGGDSPPDGYLKCVGIQWPWDLSSTDRQGSLQRGSWHGTVLESKRDKSGFGYVRNRYLDPAAGRFTQEDPIGLAGGLNLYGFANGDPVNFSDPFGLCPESMRDKNGKCPGGLTIREWDQVEFAANHFLSGDARHRVLGALNAGKIVSAELDPDKAGEVRKVMDPQEIRLNRVSSTGNAFEYAPGDLAWLLAHESQHVEQAKGQSLGRRLWHNAKYNLSPTYKAAIEGDANAYACANALMPQGYAYVCPR